jgi:hypothetical protein
MIHFLIITPRALLYQIAAASGTALHMVPDAMWLEGLEPVVGVQVGSAHHLRHGTGVNQLHSNSRVTSTAVQAAAANRGKYCALSFGSAGTRPL